jgi:hypothetical protein
MTNIEKAIIIANQCKPCSDDFYSGIYQGVLLALDIESKDKDVIWPIRMKESLKNNFKKHCDTKGFSMNKRIKTLIENEIKNG